MAPGRCPCCVPHKMYPPPPLCVFLFLPPHPDPLLSLSFLCFWSLLVAAWLLVNSSLNTGTFKLIWISDGDHGHLRRTDSSEASLTFTVRSHVLKFWTVDERVNRTWKRLFFQACEPVNHVCHTKYCKHSLYGASRNTFYAKQMYIKYSVCVCVCICVCCLNYHHDYFSWKTIGHYDNSPRFLETKLFYCIFSYIILYLFLKQGFTFIVSWTFFAVLWGAALHKVSSLLRLPTHL